MERRLIIILLVFIVKITSAQSIEVIADSIMLKNNIPEMTFAVVTKDSILVQKTLGHHKITELNQKPTAKPSDLFHLGSNTKAITGFISAFLVEHKKIKWNTKFFELFPALINNSHQKYQNITLEDLLSHRANIQPFTSGIEYGKLPKFKGNKQQRRAEFGKYVLTLVPVESDKVYNYSNAGYSVAAMMLEKVSGKSWEQLIFEVLKSKLNLDFAFGWPNRNGENQPFGHWLNNGKLTSVSPKIQYDLSLAEPAGDVSMDIKNYAHFVQLHIEGLSGKNNVLKSDTYKHLHTAKKKYAIGWGNYEQNNAEISEHAGSDGTFFSYTHIDRKNLIAYIVIVNSGAVNAQKGVFEMVEVLKNTTNTPN